MPCKHADKMIINSQEVPCPMRNKLRMGDEYWRLGSMTNQTNWTKYTGSDEQIAELKNNKNGYIVRGENLSERTRVVFDTDGIEILPFKYWIIPDDPLREMKVRQAMTGQPVWMKYDRSNVAFCTITPNWNIPNAEYSFTEFKD